MANEAPSDSNSEHSDKIKVLQGEIDASSSKLNLILTAITITNLIAIAGVLGYGNHLYSIDRKLSDFEEIVFWLSNTANGATTFVTAIILINALITLIPLRSLARKIYEKQRKKDSRVYWKEFREAGYRMVKKEVLFGNSLKTSWKRIEYDPAKDPYRDEY